MGKKRNKNTGEENNIFADGPIDTIINQEYSILTILGYLKLNMIIIQPKITKSVGSSGSLMQSVIRSMHGITSTTRLSFCPSSTLWQQLRSLLCAYCHALKTNKNPVPVDELIPVRVPNRNTTVVAEPTDHQCHYHAKKARYSYLVTQNELS